MSEEKNGTVQLESNLDYVMKPMSKEGTSNPEYGSVSKVNGDLLQKKADRYGYILTERELKKGIKAIGIKTDEFIQSEGMPTEAEEEKDLAKIENLKKGLKIHTTQKDYLERIENNYLMLVRVGKVEKSIQSVIQSGGIPDDKYEFFDKELKGIKKDLEPHPEQNTRYSKIWQNYQEHKIRKADNLIQLLIQSEKMPNKEQHDSLMEKLKKIQGELVSEKPKNQSESECFNQAYKKVNGYFEEVFGNYGKFLQEKIGDEKETTRLKDELAGMVEHNHDETIPSGSLWDTYSDYDFEVTEDQGPMVYGIWKLGGIAIGEEVGLTRETFWKEVKEEKEAKK